MQVIILRIDVWSGKMKTILLRPAMAMLELIFALVIIGITLMSAPAIVSQSVQGSNIALQQEAIAATATQIGLIQTYYWDENGSDALIDITAAEETNLRAKGFKRIIAASVQRTPANALTSENNDLHIIKGVPGIYFPDDIDDFNSKPNVLKLYKDEENTTQQNEGKYLDKAIIMTNTVKYVDDDLNDVTKASDIKLIQVRLTNSTGGRPRELEKDIRLTAFSCNIGTYKPNTYLIP